MTIPYVSRDDIRGEDLLELKRLENKETGDLVEEVQLIYPYMYSPQVVKITDTWVFSAEGLHNHPPTFITKDKQTFEITRTEPFSISIHATDKDGDTLSWRRVVKGNKTFPDIVTDAGTSFRATMSGTLSVFTNYEIDIYIDDGSNPEEKITIIVQTKQKNSKPTFDVVGSTRVITAGDLIDIPLPATDPDGDTIIYDKSTNKGKFQEDDGGTMHFIWQTQESDVTTLGTTLPITFWVGDAFTTGNARNSITFRFQIDPRLEIIDVDTIGDFTNHDLWQNQREELDFDIDLQNVDHADLTVTATVTNTHGAKAGTDYVLEQPTRQGSDDYIMYFTGKKAGKYTITIKAVAGEVSDSATFTITILPELELHIIDTKNRPIGTETTFIDTPLVLDIGGSGGKKPYTFSAPGTNTGFTASIQTNDDDDTIPTNTIRYTFESDTPKTYTDTIQCVDSRLDRDGNADPHTISRTLTIKVPFPEARIEPIEDFEIPHNQSPAYTFSIPIIDGTLPVTILTNPKFGTVTTSDQGRTWTYKFTGKSGDAVGNYTPDDYEESFRLRDSASPKKVVDVEFTITVNPPPLGKPGAPRNVRLKRGGSKQLIATWDVPSSNGGHAITKYHLQYKHINPPHTWANVSKNITTLTHTIGGLLNGIFYHARVRAFNSAQWSDWSQSNNMIPQAPNPQTITPNAPTGLTANMRYTDADISWTAPTNTSAINSYTLEWREGTSGTWNIIADLDKVTYTLAGLTDETTYQFRVKAINNSGSSPYSTIISGTTLEILEPELEATAPSETEFDVEASRTFSFPISELKGGDDTYTLTIEDDPKIGAIQESEDENKKKILSWIYTAPDIPPADNVFTVNLKLTSGTQDITYTFEITITPRPVEITDVKHGLVSGAIGTDFVSTMSASYGTGTYAWSATDGTFDDDTAKSVTYTRSREADDHEATQSETITLTSGTTTDTVIMQIFTQSQTLTFANPGTQTTKQYNSGKVYLKIDGGHAPITVEKRSGAGSVKQETSGANKDKWYWQHSLTPNNKVNTGKTKIRVSDSTVDQNGDLDRQVIDRTFRWNLGEKVQLPDFVADVTRVIFYGTTTILVSTTLTQNKPNTIWAVDANLSWRGRFNTDNFNVGWETRIITASQHILRNLHPQGKSTISFNTRFTAPKRYFGVLETISFEFDIIDNNNKTHNIDAVLSFT